MFRPPPLYIGLRYTRAKRRNHFISFISAASILGIALGVWALIVILSVINGFERALHERILGSVAHATMSVAQGEMVNWPRALDNAGAHPQVAAAAPYIERAAMLKGRAVKGALIRGVVPGLERQVSELADHMIHGDLEDLVAGSRHIVLGVSQAESLGLAVGDQVTVYAPIGDYGAAVAMLPKVMRFTISGIFELGMHEYDSGLALVHMQDAGALFGMADGVTGVRLKVTDLLQARRIASELQAQSAGLYWIRDWSEQHSNLFRAIKMQKTMMFVIVSLIIAVAAFNMVSTLVMVVVDKQSDIAILRTLGLSPARTMAVFIVLGIVVGGIGTALGLALGVLTATHIEQIVPWLERLFDTRFLSGEIYYISDLPAEMAWGDVLNIAGLALLLTATATLYPAWRASRTEPAEALRYD